MARRLTDAAATEALGVELEASCPPGTVIHLVGDLGAGKTTLARGFLRAAGYDGPVRSPTFTLLEPYDTPHGRIVHLDLYRIAGAEELEAIGLREYLDGSTRLLIEWPERGGAALPRADVTVRLEAVEEGRRAVVLMRNSP